MVIKHSLQENPLLKRVVAVFDKDQSGELDFKVSQEGPSIWYVSKENYIL